VKCSLATVVQENPSSSESESLLLVHVGKLVSSDPPGHGPYLQEISLLRSVL
jgi:hypothetical protein